MGISADKSDVDVVPICWDEIPWDLSEEESERRKVLEVAVKAFPVPGSMSAWEDILDFKTGKPGDVHHVYRVWISTTLVVHGVVLIV